MFDATLVEEVRSRIRDVPDFPKKGILFKDITPAFAHGPTFQRLIEAFAERYRTQKIDAIAGIESRGFLLAAPTAARLGKGVVLLRKPGKLPHLTHRESYALEYGNDALEIHQDAIRPGMRIVIMDDLLATGGTMGAAVRLARRLEAEVVEASFVIELEFLAGRKRLEGVPVAALLGYG